jgi:hypothetical protein
MQAVARTALRLSLLGPALALIAGAASLAANGSGCAIETCGSLRTTLETDRHAWAACDPSRGDDQCTIVGGDSMDCTGVLTCDFAVNVSMLAQAQRGVIDNSVHAKICSDYCSLPNCAQDSPPVCDPVTRECTIVYLTQAEAGATDVPQTPPQDAGQPAQD